MNLQKARELAAQIYCEPTNSSKILDPDLCESFARMLVRETSDAAMYEHIRQKILERPELVKNKPAAFAMGVVPRTAEAGYFWMLDQLLRTIYEIQDDNKSKAPES